MDDLLILGLATWRLASLLANEDGPFDFLEELRQLTARISTMLAEGVECVWCVSVWLGVALAAGYSAAPRMTVLVALPLALSAVAVVVDELIDWLRGNRPASVDYGTMQLPEPVSYVEWPEVVNDG